MVCRLEEAIAAVAAPDVTGRSDELRVCAALFGGSRYLMYATGALVVVLVENQEAAMPQNPRSEAKRPSQFDLWQIWTGDDAIRCIRFNTTRKAARGAIALCVDEGRGVLLMPCGAGAASSSGSSSRVNAGVGMSARSGGATGDDAFGPSTLGGSSAHATGDVSSDYAKVHLNLQHTTWRESVRWKSEDRLMDRLEWVESGADDLLLIGAGEKITIWKVIDDTVQVYLQRSFSLRCGADQNVSHFDAATSSGGRFLATAGKHDRIAKVWHLNNLDHDGTPICLYLAHQRALQRLQWSKDAHTFKTRSQTTQQSVATTAIAHCEILFTLDKAGNVSIWRENVASTARSFVLWKIFSGQDYLLQPDSERFFFDADRDANASIRTFGLVSHHWARPIASTLTAIGDAMLDEANVLSALSMFHYGHNSLEDARRSELYSQRRDGITKMNGKLLGDKSGAIADTHAGETFICGNATLSKTFAVHLLYGVHDNGDLCLFRTEFILFSGVTPRVSLLLIFSGLRTQLVNANIISICSSDYKDRENGSPTFVIEIVFQPQRVDTYLKVARLKLQADSSSFGGGRSNRGSVCYSVQSCEIGDLCDCVFGAKQRDGKAISLAISTARSSASEETQSSIGSGPSPLKVAVSNIGNRVDIFSPSASLRKLQVICRPHPIAAMSAATHAVCFENQSVLFFFAEGKLHAATAANDNQSGAVPVASTAPVLTPPLPFLGGRSSMKSGSIRSGLIHGATMATICFVDSDNGEDKAELNDLVVLRVPESQKLDWSSPPSIFGKMLQSSSSRSSKDFCVVVGLKRGGTELVVWVFEFEPSASTVVIGDDNGDDDELGLSSPLITPISPVSMKLFRRTNVPIPHNKTLAGISSVPSLQAFDVIFATIDAHFSFDLWTFTDLDDLLEVKSIQTTNITELINKSTAFEKPKDSMNFNFVKERFEFKQFSLSACGRVAVLFEKDDGKQPTAANAVLDAQICILPAFESCCEGIVIIEQKKLGVIVSLEWTPPVTAERDCELLFLSTTTIGMIKFDASAPINKWYIAWSSSRFNVKPQKISSLNSYPHALLALGASIASINLHDLSGASTAAGTCGGLPFRLSQAIGVQQPTMVNSSALSPSAFPVYHPVTLMFLLLRGSFKILERVLEHVKEEIIEHEKACYLRMMDDKQLKALPLLSLSKLLGQHQASDNGEGESEDRSATYLNGKQPKSSGFGSSYSSASSAAAPARASDLFAMDYRSTRNADRAEMLFAPRSSALTSFGDSTTVTEQAAVLNNTQSSLEGTALSLFFNEHKSLLTFMTPQEGEAFMAIINGLKKTVAWERDASRKKDEAALRFQASLLWPLEQEGGESGMSKHVGTNTDPDGGTLGEDDTDAESAASKRAVGICSEQVVWGAITDFQDELLQECFTAPMMAWKEMKQLRLPFWVKSVSKLQQFTEKAAQAEYASTRDPFHVALFYVLLGKTKLLASLFKMANESRISELLSNDFSDPRWKNAAIKNAYVLKAKRRYELSTAFFLLGGKVQEAMSVAEHADRTLVLSFLIARLSEKWDLGGESDDSNSGTSDFGQFSFSGLSSNMRTFNSSAASSTEGGGDASSSGCKGVCEEFLKTTVLLKARTCGDIYMSFLVKYFLGETLKGIQCLLTVPSIEMRCMFGTCGQAYAYPYTLYWRAFGQSMLGACEIVRFLQSTIVPLKLALKTQIVSLQTLALSRLQGMGLSTLALLQQRDFAKFFVQFCQDKSARSPEAAAFLACRHRILVGSLGSQVDSLYTEFLNRIRQSMMGKSTLLSPISSANRSNSALESGINDEIQCVLSRGGNFVLENVSETATSYVEGALRSSVVQSLVHSRRLAGLDFLVFEWNSLLDAQASRIVIPQFMSPLPYFIELITEGITLVALGDLVASSTDQVHTRRIDQTCSQLLSAASRLLLWLSYYYSKPSEQRVCMTSSEYVRVAAAAIYSVICVCSRYIRSPCCLYRSLGIIFPHKDALPRKALEELREIALLDVCVHCSEANRQAAQKAKIPGITSSLQQDLPVLYQVVEMLQNELDNFVADVKTNRLQLSTAAPSPFFTYCQYWTLALMMAASGMPVHITKIAVEGANPVSESTAAAKKLVQAWTTYNSKLSMHAVRKLLCDLAELFFRPFEVGSTTATFATAGDKSAAAHPSGTTSGSSSPTKKDTGRDTRRLLGCACTRCPWLLILKMFTEKDEFLLRLNAQLECCSEKIKDEISWGHLPDFPSKKSVLTRSQKILLTSAAGGKGPGTPRAADLVDLFEKRMQTPAPVVLNTSCIYRSEVSIKSMCFNRAAETAEMVLCSSKGICRTGCADYSDGSKFQFKGMYANPQASFFSDANPAVVRRTIAENLGANNADLNAAIGPPLSIGSRVLASSPSSSSMLSGSAAPSPSDAKVPSFKPTAVESHPFLPLFISGNQKGKVHLWSYDSLSAVCAFRIDDIVAPYPSSPALTSRRDIKKIKFDNLGQQMGAVDTLGRLLMWKFSNLDRETCYRQIECHDKGAKALTFINSGSCVATVGSSTEKRSVCIWDLLLPRSKALIAAPVCHPAGAASVAFSSIHQLLISGGEGGSISVFDMRQRRVLHTVSNAHETAITTLELHPSGQCVLSGSASGDVKIWSLPIFREVTSISKVHAKPSFLGDAASNILGDAASNMAINVTNSSWGVTDAVATDTFFFTSGTDGSVQRMNVPSLSKLF